MSSSTTISLDAVLVNAISNATVEVLRTMANTEVKLEGVLAMPDYTPSGDISAVIGITGDSGEGMISLSFPMNFASLIVSRLLGSPAGLISADDRCDGVGEIVNMISGNAKVALSNGEAAPYKLSLPTIILGSGHAVASRPRNNPYLIMKFQAEGMSFALQMSFKFKNAG